MPTKYLSPLAQAQSLSADELFKVLVEMPAPQWFALMRVVGRERNARWNVAREMQSDRLAATMDMTPEGYVREWIARGRKNVSLPLDAWEHAYQRAGIPEQAMRLGYIEIGRDVALHGDPDQQGRGAERRSRSEPYLTHHAHRGFAWPQTGR